MADTGQQANPATTGTVVVTLKAEDTPLAVAGVAVTLQPATGALLAATTDGAGRASFADVPIG